MISGAYLVGVSAQGDTECSGQTKIGKLEVALTVNEQILRLQITVQDAVTVAVPNTLNQLRHELLHHSIAQTQACH